MTDVGMIALVGGAIAVLPSTVVAVVGFLNQTAIRRVESQNAKTSETLVKLEKNTNGLEAALLKLTGEAEHAKGVIEGHAQAINLSSLSRREKG